MSDQHLRSFKSVPQVDEEGYFTGMCIADESPLRPGEYEYARGALDVAAPPRVAAKYEAIRWTGSDWAYEPDYTSATLYDIRTGEQLTKEAIARGQSLEELFATFLQPKYGQHWNAKDQCWEWTLTQLKTFKLSELAELRWGVQCAGIKAPGVADVVFASSPDDKTRLLQTIDDAVLMGDEVVTFKAQSGFVDLTVEQLRAGYKAIVQHTQACYKCEKAHTDAINALGSAEDVELYNLNSGWPI